MGGHNRGFSTSSGTDSAVISPNDVGSAEVIAFKVQSATTRARFPDMASPVNGGPGRCTGRLDRLRDWLGALMDDDA